MSIASWLGFGRLEPRPCPTSVSAWRTEVRVLAMRYATESPVMTAIRVRRALQTPVYAAQIMELAQEEATRLIEAWDGADRPTTVRWVAWYVAAQVELGYLDTATARDLMVTWVREQGGVALDPSWQDDDASTERMQMSLS